MDGYPRTLEQLNERLKQLEQRVYSLEHAGEASVLPSAPAVSPVPSGAAVEPLPFANAGGAFPVLGKAMLGIAGAYLLRAVAEAGSLPQLVVAAIAIAYAILWLFWASRVKPGEWLASSVYVGTSALILAPMLWELTLRFKILPAAAAAGVLCVYFIAATGLAWSRNLASLFWVANITAAAAALFLSFGAHDLSPFLAGLLLQLVVCEVAAARNRAIGARLLVMAAADIAVWTLTFIYSAPQITRMDYPALGLVQLMAPASLLFLIAAVSVAFKAFACRLPLSWFEVGQALVAFLLVASAVFAFAPGFAVPVLGGASLALSAASYVCAFVFLSNPAAARNSVTFSTWGLALLLFGCWLLLSGSWLAVSLALVSAVASLLCRRLGLSVFGLHGFLLLLAAAVAAGLLRYVFGVLALSLPVAPGVGIWVVTACAILVYAATEFSSGAGPGSRTIPLLVAFIAVCSLTALLVQGIVWVAGLGITPEVSQLALIRTLCTCSAALVLAFAGARWLRSELGWLATVALALVTVKLIMEDLRHGRLAFIAASILLFAVTLIALPRLARLGQRLRGLD